MILGGFKLVCGQCGSDKVVQKSARKKLHEAKGCVIYAEGVERKCMDCSNESFVVHRTWSRRR